MLFSGILFNVEYFWTILFCIIGFLVLIGNVCLVVAQYKEIKELRMEVARLLMEEERWSRTNW